MRLYYFWNDSHRVLVDDFFLPTLREHNNHFSVYGVRLPSSNSGVVRFGTHEFQKMMIKKAEWVANLIEEGGDPFVVSDVDIQFFGSVEEELTKSLSNEKDMTFQLENAWGGANTGFMLLKPNKMILHFWRDVVKTLKNTADSKLNEQAIVNSKLKLSEFGNFGPKIWNWSQGGLANDILLHHANCVGTAQEKINQMMYVRDVVQKSLYGV